MSPSTRKPASWSVRIVKFTLDRYTLDKACWNYDHALQVLAIGRAGEAEGEQPPSKTGGFRHTKIYPYRVWLDGDKNAGTIRDHSDPAFALDGSTPRRA